MSEMDALIDQVLGPPPARGRRARPISASVVRDLNNSDIEALWAVPAGGLESSAPLVKLRQHHHYLARLLAEGRKNQECALLTGMDDARISVLRQDPAMRELIEHYKTQVDEVYINVHERLASLGLNSVAELQDRLDDKPESFSNRELMELSALGLDRSGHGPKSTVQHDHGVVLTADVMEKLKNELAKRSNGQVRPLTSSSERAEMGKLIEHEPLADASPEAGSKGEGSEL